jgi:hypothetical protein
MDEYGYKMYVHHAILLITSIIRSYDVLSYHDWISNLSSFGGKNQESTMANTTPTVVVKLFYITTGRKNAFYTLRSQNNAAGYSFEMPTNHVCTLAADEEKAIQKAQNYVDAFRARVPETDTFKIEFHPWAEQETFKRRGKLSVFKTQQLEMVDSGVMPFGKHKDKVIADLPESTVLYYASQSGQTIEPVKSAVCDVCLGVALENGYIEHRDKKRAENVLRDARSHFIGEPGQRLDFTGEMIWCVEKGNYFVGAEFVAPYFVNRIRSGDDIIVYIGGKRLAENGEILSIRATVKKHEEFKGVKTTVVNRPKLVMVKTND